MASEMPWRVGTRVDPDGRVLADRHYNRQSIGADNFVPPGRCFVLVIPGAAVWVTSWPFAEYVKHAWGGAWVNSLFRNEASERYRSSELIRTAVAATRWHWPEVPDLGIVTFVDAGEVRPKRDPGRCYLRAGFVTATPPKTEGGLYAFQMLATSMPEARPAIGESWGLL